MQPGSTLGSFTSSISSLNTQQVTAGMAEFSNTFFILYLPGGDKKLTTAGTGGSITRDSTTEQTAPILKTWPDLFAVILTWVPGSKTLPFINTSQ